MERSKFRKLILWFILLSPFLIFLLMGRKNIFAMAIAITLFWTILPMVILFEGLNKETSILTLKSRFREKIKNKTLRKYNLVFRVLLVMIAFYGFYEESLPIYIDVYDLTTKHEIIAVRGIVTYHSSPGLLWIFSQSVRVNGGEIIYSYYFSPRHQLRKGNEFEFLILPRSKIILSAEQIQK